MFLAPVFLVAPFLLRAVPVSAAPVSQASHVDQDLVCLEAATETVTVAVTATVYANPPSSSPVAVHEGPPASTTTDSPISRSSITAYTTDVGPPRSLDPVASPAQQSGHSALNQSTTLPPKGPADSANHNRQYKNVLYFANWGIYAANYQPDQIPAKDVTHVLYSFADISSDGTVKSSDAYADVDKHYPTDSWQDTGKNAYGCVKQLFILKKRNRHLKVLLSIGGWTWSPKFVPVAATEAGRQRFASSAVKLLADWGFDGLDIDWEYPHNPGEARDFVLLLKACRKALDDYAAKHAKGYHFLITVATPAGPQHYGNMDLEGMDAIVDVWNLMAYDYAGGWDRTSGHQSNIYNNPDNQEATKFSTDKAVRDYVARGIDPHKITMGLPLYGRSFEGTNGLGEVFTDVGPGSIEPGVWLYKDLPRTGATEKWDDKAGASYSYDASTKELISYDNVRSAEVKSDYIKGQGLGGAVFWQASGDRSGPESLVGTVASRLRLLDQTENWLSYPASQYDNIRDGIPGE